MIKCPYCAEEIQEDAKKCRYCGEWLTQLSGSAKASPQEDSKRVPWVAVVLNALWFPWFVSSWTFATAIVWYQAWDEPGVGLWIISAILSLIAKFVLDQAFPRTKLVSRNHGKEQDDENA